MPYKTHTQPARDPGAQEAYPGQTKLASLTEHRPPRRRPGPRSCSPAAAEQRQELPFPGLCSPAGRPGSPAATRPAPGTSSAPPGEDGGHPHGAGFPTGAGWAAREREEGAAPQARQRPPSPRGPGARPATHCPARGARCRDDSGRQAPRASSRRPGSAAVTLSAGARRSRTRGRQAGALPPGGSWTLPGRLRPPSGPGPSGLLHEEEALGSPFPSPPPSHRTARERAQSFPRGGRVAAPTRPPVTTSVTSESLTPLPPSSLLHH